LAVQAVVLWQLAGLAKSDWVRVRPIVAVLFISFVVNAILVWTFFFIVPLATAVTLCLRRGRTDQPSSAFGTWRNIQREVKEGHFHL
jgi:hypothetical protein